MQQNNAINKTESQTIEFKQVWKDDYLKTICAFANSEGGLLYIGVADNGKIVGVNNAKTLLEILPNKINNRLGILNSFSFSGILKMLFFSLIRQIIQA